jgi:RNA polymerase sigma-70 factor (ECF subfamily)
LSSAEREIVTLKHLDGLSYEEIAERLEIPKGTVMSRLFNARKHLREKLALRKVHR